MWITQFYSVRQLRIRQGRIYLIHEKSLHVLRYYAISRASVGGGDTDFGARGRSQ